MVELWIDDQCFLISGEPHDVAEGLREKAQAYQTQNPATAGLIMEVADAIEAAADVTLLKIDRGLD